MPTMGRERTWTGSSGRDKKSARGGTAEVRTGSSNVKRYFSAQYHVSRGERKADAGDTSPKLPEGVMVEDLWRQRRPVAGGSGRDSGSYTLYTESSDRARSYASNRSALSSASTAASGGGRLGKLRPPARTLDGEKRLHLFQIRSTELHDDEMNEEPMPVITEGLPTFASLAHLRGEAYWRELLGEEDAGDGICDVVDTVWFHTLICASIVVNTVLFSMDDEETTPVLQLRLRHFVLGFSLLEIGILLYRASAGAIRDPLERAFGTIDAVAVFGCVAEQWLLPAALAAGALPELWMQSELRTFTRLCWLMRFLRLVRLVPKLRELVRGVWQALQGLVWVFVFVFMLLFVLAALVKVLIGDGLLNDLVHGAGASISDEAEEVRQYFASVTASIFTLFQTMSSGSLMPLIPLFEEVPCTRIFFGGFYVYAGWTLLAVMTGTVSFTMIAIKAQIVSEDEARVQEKKQRVQEVLRDIFEKLDEDGSGALDHDEFQMILQSSEVLALLSNNTDIKVQDLQDIWAWLDDDGSGEVSVDEFLQMFQWLGEPFTPKTLMKLEERLTRDIRQLRLRLENMIGAQFGSLVAQVQSPISKIHTVAEQVSVLSASLLAVLGALEKYETSPEVLDGAAEPSAVAQVELAGLEDSLGTQIEEVLERMRRWELTPPQAPRAPARNSLQSLL